MSEEKPLRQEDYQALAEENRRLAEENRQLTDRYRDRPLTKSETAARGILITGAISTIVGIASWAFTHGHAPIGAASMAAVIGIIATLAVVNNW